MKRFVWPLGLVLLSGLAAGRASADPPATLADLKRLNAAQLEQLYTSADAAPIAHGFVRGEVLYLADTGMPRLKTKLAGLVWKGKVFDENHGFVNQWVCFRAIQSKAYLGHSFHDGRLSVILEYPEGTPLFGNMRDEARLVGPGLYLAMVFERTAPYKFRGFIGLEVEVAKGHKGH